MSRDSKGRFKTGYIEDDLTREKRLKALKLAAKSNPNYLGELKSHPLYNIWRSFKFTKKGKKIGNSKDWDNFKTFYNEVIPFYEKNKRFNRKDTSKPYSIDNFIFLTEEEAGLRKKTEKSLIYKGVNKPLEEWAVEFDLRLGPLRQRYYHGLKYKHSAERILFGFRYAKSKEVKDHKELEKQLVRNKASKMIASYNNSDKKKGFDKGDLNIDWFIENVFNKSCSYCGDNSKLGVDRIDNTKGHLKSNVVPACYECNIARANNFTYDEMLIIGKAINKVKSARKNSG